MGWVVGARIGSASLLFCFSASLLFEHVCVCVSVCRDSLSITWWGTDGRVGLLAWACLWWELLL